MRVEKEIFYWCFGKPNKECIGCSQYEECVDEWEKNQNFFVKVIVRE